MQLNQFILGSRLTFVSDWKKLPQNKFCHAVRVMFSWTGQTRDHSDGWPLPTKVSWVNFKPKSTYVRNLKKKSLNVILRQDVPESRRTEGRTTWKQKASNQNFRNPAAAEKRGEKKSFIRRSLYSHYTAESTLTRQWHIQENSCLLQDYA